MVAAVEVILDHEEKVRQDLASRVAEVVAAAMGAKPKRKRGG